MGNIIKFNDLISMNKAAKLLGVPYHTAYDWIVTNNEIPHVDYGFGRKKVVSEAEVYKLIEKRIVETRKVV